MRVGRATLGIAACSHTAVITDASCFAARGDKRVNSAGDQPVAPLAVPLLKTLAKRVAQSRSAAPPQTRGGPRAAAR